MDDATVSKQDENAIKKIKKAKKNKRRGIASKAAHKARREEERELARLVKDGAESCITTSTIPDDCFLQVCLCRFSFTSLPESFNQLTLQL